MALRHRLVVLRRDRACLRSEGEWRLVTDFGDAFRLDATLRRQRIANALDRGIGGHRVPDCFGAHVPARTAADAVSRGKARSRGWTLAVRVVAETQEGGAVDLRLHDEVGRIWGAVQQIALHRP